MSAGGLCVLKACVVTVWIYNTSRFILLATAMLNVDYLSVLLPFRILIFSILEFTGNQLSRKTRTK